MTPQPPRLVDRLLASVPPDLRAPVLALVAVVLLLVAWQTGSARLVGEALGYLDAAEQHVEPAPVDEAAPEVEPAPPAETVPAPEPVEPEPA